MRLKLFALIYYFGLFQHYAGSQSLKIGDRCPDFQLTDLINFERENVKLSEFKGKAIIIDFWATNCSACITSMPKLDSLQKKFGDRLQILLVSHESREKILKFYEGRDRLKNLNILTAANDTELELSFPHASIPHQVWLDPSLNIVAITDQSSLTESNLHLLLEGKSLSHLPFKWDSEYYPGAETGTLVGTAWEERKQQLLYYSYIGGHRDDLLSLRGIPKTNNGGKVRITATNQSLANLYLVAYNKMKNFHLSRVEFVVADLDKYKPDYKLNKNLYCYELIIHDTSKLRALKTMQLDLDRFFGTESKLEFKKVNCFILKRTSGIDKVTSKNPGKSDVFEPADVVVVNNVPFPAIVANLSRRLPFELFDETGFKNKSSLTFPKAYLGIVDINKMLCQYDLILEEQVREMEVLVIKGR